MKRLTTILIPILIVTVFLLDFSRKRRSFHQKKTELEATLGFSQVETMINTYFFNSGWFPDSLQQVDTIFNQKITVRSGDAIIETRYRFLIDPFSGCYFKYIPIYNERKKAEGFFLLSAGIDGSFNNTSGDNPPQLYDSLTFNYYDLYFGVKDIVISKGTIGEFLSHKGFILSLDGLVRRYPPSGRRKPPRFIEFAGTIEGIYSDHLVVREQSGGILANCYLAPSDSAKFPTDGMSVCLRGIFNRITIEPDTVVTFLNCMVLDPRECEAPTSN